MLDEIFIFMSSVLDDGVKGARRRCENASSGRLEIESLGEGGEPGSSTCQHGVVSYM